jgi:hypothetical protein
MTYWRGNSSGSAKNKLTLSMIVGTLLVPVSAVAAIWLSDPGQVAEAETPTTTTTPAVANTAQPAPAFDNVRASEADLRAACGYVGMTLVDAERNGTISDVQQAALDALRDICDEQGLSLPPPPTPDPQTVVVQEDSSGGATTTTSPSTAPAPTVDDENEGEHHEGSEQENEHESEGEGGE